MDEAPLEGGDQAEIDPEVGDVDEAQSESVETDARSYVEVDDPDNRFVRVKVDGEEVEVPFSELQRGYSREASYTQKSQALAERARDVEYAARLQQALQSNPQKTLEILAEQYGLTVGQVKQQLDKDPEIEYQDPLERQLYEERQARLALEQRINQRETDEQLERSISGLQQRYNLSNEDIHAVVNTAYQMQIGPEAFDMIWQSMAFQRIQARVQATRDAEAKKAEATQQRTAAKAAASGVVSTGTGAVGTTNQVDAARNMTVREALDAAFEQLGIQ